MAQITDKKVKLNLVGIDSNAFAVMGNFKQQAKKEKWTTEEIDSVLNKAMAGDYNHLLATILEHCDDQENNFQGTGGEIDPRDFE